MTRGRTLVYCTHCRSMADTSWAFHICTVYGKDWDVISRVKRVWNQKLKCWDLAPGEKEPEFTLAGRYYDTKTNKWVDMATGQPVASVRQLGPGPEEKKDITLQSCGVSFTGEKKEKKEKPQSIRSHHASCSCWNCWSWAREAGLTIQTWSEWMGHYPSSSHTYVDVKPWDGVEFKKWPNTFYFLLRYFYAGNEWYSGANYISGKEYQDRILRGIYVEKEKPGKKVEAKEKEKPKGTSESRDPGDEQSEPTDSNEAEEFWRRWSDYGEV